jgi:hypothetical protein
MLIELPFYSSESSEAKLGSHDMKPIGKPFANGWQWYRLLSVAALLEKGGVVGEYAQRFWDQEDAKYSILALLNQNGTLEVSILINTTVKAIIDVGGTTRLVSDTALAAVKALARQTGTTVPAFEANRGPIFIDGQFYTKQKHIRLKDNVTLNQRIDNVYKPQTLEVEKELIIRDTVVDRTWIDSEIRAKWVKFINVRFDKAITSVIKAMKIEFQNCVIKDDAWFESLECDDLVLTSVKSRGISNRIIVVNQILLNDINGKLILPENTFVKRGLVLRNARNIGYRSFKNVKGAVILDGQRVSSREQLAGVFIRVQD